MTNALEPHPFAEVFPILEGEAFDALVKDIEARGQQEPIWVYEGKVLDGRNRYRACQILGREPKVQDFVGDEPVGFVLSANLHRRHLNEGQRAMVAANLSNLVLGANQHTKAGLLSVKQASALLKVGTASIERAKAILRSGDTELIKDVTTGEVSVTAAAQTVKKKNRKSKTQSSETEEDKLGNEKQKLSDTNDRLVEKLMENLKKWKDLDEENALTATSNLLDQLKAADLIEDRKRRKAA